ncbi:hypothetical protein ASG49_06900 [Marmoricola sp. Leaf446]|uniref:mycothiol transferase n=1 Tax=Marmoricola sp. Leaf446 TaxID=1736379 RepID=UPI0006FD29E5|nr:DinB family protein [Marmoricola sp. Leaf446]KQT94575.1 hypothetical protein ASG49_06900 [Marmoricola sp. Leaf446]
MDPHALLVDHVGRVRELVVSVVDGLDLEQAHQRPLDRGNPVVWLLWHTSRVLDDHVAGLSGDAQAWAGWASRFDLPLDIEDFGYGHGPEEVAAVRVADLDLLVAYHEAVHERTLSYLRRLDPVSGVGPDELDRVVDEGWDPPVTAGVRLVSVIGDCLQHLGQAAYVKGLL